MGFGYIAFQYDKRAPTTGLTRTNLPYVSLASFQFHKIFAHSTQIPWEKKAMFTSPVQERFT